MLKGGSLATEDGFVTLCPSKGSNQDLLTLEQVGLVGRIQNIFCGLCSLGLDPQYVMSLGKKDFTNCLTLKLGENPRLSR